MNGKQLKNSILQWAIQGKLVQQDPNDEPASVLLEHIREEKAKLVKEKKIKKDKNESIIYRGDDNSYYEKFIATGEVKCIDEEIPFEIPNGWEWERVGNIFFVTKLAGFEYTKFFTKEAISAFNPIPIVRAQNVRMGFFEENKNEAISEMLSNQLKRSALNKKCLLMTFIGAGIGDTCIFPAERKNHLAPNVAKIEPLDDSIFLDYAVFALMSPCGQRGVNAIKKSTAQPSLSMETIRKLLIPIPPFKEQKCISLKLSEVLPLVEKYSKVQKVQNQINDEINILLSKSILQEAIRGKLVPQIAEEGTADKLLAEIHKEKERLVKEGKLKKAILTDSVIYKGDDNKYYERINAQTVEIELPFEYPNSWAVLRLKDICQLIDGEKRNGKGICLDAKYLRGKSSATIIEKGKYVYTDDNIILVDGENSGEVFTVPQDGYMGSTFKQLWLSSTMWKPYILAFILFYKEELRNSKRGAAIPHLNKELFYNLPIGIPPYQEQQRIAERINELSQLLK
ncbi:restriction endonuclease subunit S [Bacteroides fragilis]|uniref:restriction endonuclease subunit S n=1 Tax=Bacteroides fragilis TaxID=817 RepID=UPI00202E71EB|nr:restriction endonuclease subunit S [Bacteroides fragilis]MCM0303039.1 restriction endonuclease subunit S [Bacteroides fragilis]